MLGNFVGSYLFVFLQSFCQFQVKTVFTVTVFLQTIRHLS